MLRVTTATGAIVIAVLVIGGAQRVFAANDGKLKGRYAFQTTGNALLVGSSPADCVPSLTPAGLSGTLSFDGAGKITALSAVTFDIAGTVCSAANYSVSGTYSVDAKGPGDFSADGIINVIAQGPRSPCKQMFVTGLNFSLTGDTNRHTITLSTFGADETSTYAKGTPAGGVTCQATVQDFSTSGVGSLVR